MFSVAFSGEYNNLRLFYTFYSHVSNIYSNNYVLSDACYHSFLEHCIASVVQSSMPQRSCEAKFYLKAHPDSKGIDQLAHLLSLIRIIAVRL